jgi:predicted transcriptional regulator
MKEATFTVRVDESLKEQFTSAAKGSDRTGAQLLRDFMRDFVRQQEVAAHDQWVKDKVQASLADAQPNIAHAQVMRDARALINKKRKQHAGKAAG